MNLIDALKETGMAHTNPLSDTYLKFNIHKNLTWYFKENNNVCTCFVPKESDVMRTDWHPYYKEEPKKRMIEGWISLYSYDGRVSLWSELCHTEQECRRQREKQSDVNWLGDPIHIRQEVEECDLSPKEKPKCKACRAANPDRYNWDTCEHLKDWHCTCEKEK